MQIANNHMKRHSIQLIIREMQIKTTVRYHLTAVRMAIIYKSTNNKCWSSCEEKGTLLYFWWECKLVQPLWKVVCRCLRKLQTELTYDPVIPLLGTYPDKTVIQKDTFTQCSWQHYSQQPRCGSRLCPLTDEWVKSMWYIHAKKSQP